ncbi:MAG: hypothetical protein LC739_06185 [Actinobacteria bacterium]|nr:hypothetical protein [Actinomycetota bacterium]
MSGADHVRVLASLAGIGGPGMIVAHDGDLDVPWDHTLVTIEPGDALVWGWDVVTAKLASTSADWPEHDPAALTRMLHRPS